MPLIVATLQAELVGIFEKPKGNPVPTPVAMDLAKAFNNYTLTAIVIGVVPDTPGVPFTGPIS